MDVYDPTQRQLPPPRHQLESDSEEDSDQEAQAAQGSSSLASGSNSKFTQARPTSRSGREPLKIDTVLVGGQTRQDVSSDGESAVSAVIFDGEAAESLLLSLRTSTARGIAAAETSRAAQTVELRVVGVPQSVFLHSTSNGTMISATSPSPHIRSRPEALQDLGSTIIERVNARSITILTSYNAVTYIRSGEELEQADPPSLSDAPIRYLTQTRSQNSSAAVDPQPKAALPPSLQPFQVPNVLTGLAASLVSHALLSSTVETIHVILVPYATPQPHAEYYSSAAADGEHWSMERANAPPPPPMAAQAAKVVLDALKACEAGFEVETVRDQEQVLLEAFQRSRAGRAGAGAPPGSDEDVQRASARLRAAGDGNMYI